MIYLFTFYAIKPAPDTYPQSPIHTSIFLTHALKPNTHTNAKHRPTDACTYTHIHSRTHARTRMHAHTRTQTHTNTHTHRKARSRLNKKPLIDVCDRCLRARIDHRRHEARRHSDKNRNSAPGVRDACGQALCVV